MDKHPLIPITYVNWDIVETDFLQFYGVEFIEPFGPIPKNSKFESCSVDWTTGTLECYEIGEVKETVKFKVIPV